MTEIMTVEVPDIGDFQDVEIIEVLVKVGDTVAPEDPLITLESDKASMEIPSPFGGVVRTLRVRVGDRVAQGKPILDLESEPAAAGTGARSALPTSSPSASVASGSSAAVRSAHDADSVNSAKKAGTADSADSANRTDRTDSATKGSDPGASTRSGPAAAGGARTSPTAHISDERAFRKAHASPSVRRFARELGVDLGKVDGSGRKRRILREDVQGFVKRALAQPVSSGLGIEPMPVIDFSEFGPTELQPLTKINKLAGKNLHRNWVSVPHVTQFDEADITELEDFRNSLKSEYEKKGVKITFLPFLMKAVVSVLKQFPRFNASLDATGENLILKQYYHLGVAVDTPDGLVVPVVRDVDRKSLVDLAAELMELSVRAREKRLKTKDLQGGCLTISSLGGIGGTQFTPIVNAPEVAILGVSRSAIRPVWNGDAFVPRLILPIALSYDHRVIDGALGARFTSTLAGLLSDMRRMLL